MGTLYCDLGATPWRQSSELLIQVYDINTAQLREPRSCNIVVPVNIVLVSIFLYVYVVLVIDDFSHCHASKQVVMPINKLSCQ